MRQGVRLPLPAVAYPSVVKNAGQWTVDVLVGWLVGSVSLGITLEVVAVLLGAEEPVFFQRIGVIAGTIGGIYLMRRRRRDSDAGSDVPRAIAPVVSKPAAPVVSKTAAPLATSTFRRTPTSPTASGARRWRYDAPSITDKELYVLGQRLTSAGVGYTLHHTRRELVVRDKEESTVRGVLAALGHVVEDVEVSRLDLPPTRSQEVITTEPPKRNNRTELPERNDQVTPLDALFCRDCGAGSPLDAKYCVACGLETVRPRYR